MAVNFSKKKEFVKLLEINCSLKFVDLQYQIQCIDSSNAR